jgi:glucose dehydrogenase
MTVDVRRGIAYVPLGSPTYDFYGADRIGANLFGASIVALDARTGRRPVALPARAPRPVGFSIRARRRS